MRNTLEPCSAMWIMTTRTWLAKRTAHSRVSVHVRCVEGVLGLGGNVVIGVVRCHHADVIPSTDFFPSWFCRETSSRVVFILFWDLLTRQMLGDLFLKLTGVICLIKQDLIWWNRNPKWNLSIAVSMSFSNKVMLKDWNYRTPTTDILNPEENNLDCKENCLWRKECFEILRYGICMN